jgi:hypothetical protein
LSRTLFRPRCRAQLEVVFDGRGAANSKPFNIEIDPRSATVGLNGFYEADTWMLEFDVRLLPFDPDQIAYCGAHIYMWDDDKNTGEWATEENLMVKGLLDDVDGDIITEDNTIKFTGRDYTAILADPQWDPKTKIIAGKPLDVTVQEIADAAAPEGTRARFEVIWKGEHAPPVIGQFSRSSKKKGIHIKPGKNYWDVIWDLCIQHAYVPHVIGSQIIISEPITQTKQTLTEAPNLVYGKNLTGLKVKRKFAHETVPQIVLVAYDPDTGKKIEIIYPEKRNIIVQTNANHDARDSLGIPLSVKKDDQVFYPAPSGITDPDALKRYARMQFYHLGRGETVYSVETSHLWIDSVHPGEEVNLLRLRPGNAIGVEFDPFNREHLRALEPGQRIEYISSLGYHDEVATFVATNFDRLEFFKQKYYYNRGDISYAIDDGIDIKMEAVNFASEVREIHFAENDVHF